MTLTLLESNKYSQDMLQRGVVETFVENAPILQFLPFMEIQGNGYTYNLEETLPGIEFRGVNEGYSESTGIINPQTERLVIMGGHADVDTFQVKTQSNLNNIRAQQTRMKTKAASLKFSDHFFNGDTAVDPKGFDGLKKRIVGNQHMVADTNGFDVNTSPQGQLIDKLDALAYSVQGKADALFMDAKTLLKIRSVARDLKYFAQTVDAFGKPVTTFDDIPMFAVGDNNVGNKIIGHSEVTGTANNSTSVYAVKFGADEYVSGITNGGMQVQDLGLLQADPKYRTRIEFFTGLAIFNPKAAARLSGLIV
jgi:hypothetical protein